MTDKKWTFECKKLLISTRLRHENDFVSGKKKRTTIWEGILREIKEIDDTFPFSGDDISRCFLNVMGTYKRIKKRNNMSGEGATTWEFFDEIDEVFGCRSSIDLPLDMTESTIERLMDDLTNSPTTSERNVANDAETPVTTIRKRKNEVLTFLEKESDKDDEKIQKLLKLEAEKLEIEKEKVSELKVIRLYSKKLLMQPQISRCFLHF